MKWLQNPQTGEKRAFFNDQNAPANWVATTAPDASNQSLPSDRSIINGGDQQFPTFRITTELIIWEPYFLLLLIMFGILVLLG